jgi:transglutaminase-like putative cysteine protease
MRRRPLSAAGLALLALVGIAPAYDRVFADAGWRAPTIMAGVMAALLAAGLQRLRRGPFVAAVVSAVVLLAFLPWLLSVEDGPVLPRRGSLAALRELWSQGMVELAETPAPAPSLVGLLLLLVVAVWVVTHLAVELLGRTDQAGPALVVLTALWTVPLVVPMPPVTAWPSAVAFLAVAAVILLATTPRTDATRGRPLLPTVGLVTAAGVIAAATALPGLLPGYEEPGWFALGRGGEPRGYQPIVDVSERLRLPEERDVLRVQASQRTYLRIAGLDHFDGFRWRLGEPSEGSYRPPRDALVRATGALPPEAPAASTEPVSVDVEVLALENMYVPVPYQPQEVLGPQRDEMVWSTEGGFLATLDLSDGATSGTLQAGVREGVNYRVEAARPAPTFDELVAVEPEFEAAAAARAAEGTVDEVGEGAADPAAEDTSTGAPGTVDLARWTALPREYPRLREQALAVYEAAGATTTVERALALQDWFVGPESDFAYSLEVDPLRGGDALERFVLEDRVGYCEYYATAMAVMLRETGIPARVAVGFLPGRISLAANPAAGRELTEFTVSTADAHAWVEVLFPGYGWITFEPTPRADDSHIVPTESDLAPIENVRERRVRQLQEAAASGADDALVPDLDRLSDGDGIPRGVDEGASAGTGRAGDGLPIVPLLVLGVVLLLGIVGWTGWRRRTAPPPEDDRDPVDRVVTAQRRLLATARRHGVGRRRWETLREVAARWEAEGRVDGRATRFARLAQSAAFGGEIDAATAAEAERLAAELGAMLRRSVSAGDRRLAPVRVPAEHVATAARAARRRLTTRPGSRRPGDDLATPTRARRRVH